MQWTAPYDDIINNVKQELPRRCSPIHSIHFWSDFQSPYGVQKTLDVASSHKLPLEVWSCFIKMQSPSLNTRTEYQSEYGVIIKATEYQRISWRLLSCSLENEAELRWSDREFHTHWFVSLMYTHDVTRCRHTRKYSTIYSLKHQLIRLNTNNLRKQ